MSIARAPWWKQWLESTFKPQRPGVDPVPFGKPVVAAEDLFAWLLAASARRQRGDIRSLLRFFCGGAQQPNEPGLHPHPADKSIAGYIQRVSRLRGETGIVLNNLQSTTPAAWRLGQTLMSGLVHGTGFCAGSAVLDLFAGAYRTSFFRVHKDEQDVLTFVIEGTKRFLVWPFEVFAKHPEAVTVVNGGKTGIVLPDVDARAHRDTAIVLEGHPGDVIYWPADHWHCAISDSTENVTTLALGFFDDATPLKFVEGAARDLEAGRRVSDAPRFGSSDGDAARLIGDVLHTITGTLEDAQLHRRIEEKILAHATSFGFLALPDPRRGRAALRDGQVRLAVPGTLAFLSRSDELVLSVSGAVYSYPRSRGLETLLMQLTAGKAVEVAAGPPTLGNDSVDSGALNKVVEVLLRHHALVAA